MPPFHVCYLFSHVRIRIRNFSPFSCRWGDGRRGPFTVHRSLNSHFESIVDLVSVRGLHLTGCHASGVRWGRDRLCIPDVSKQNEKLDPILSENLKANPWFLSVFESSRHCFPIQDGSFWSLLEAIVGVSKQKARHVIHAAVRRLTRRPRGLTLVLNFFTTCSWEP